MSLIGKATGGGYFLDRQISLREQPLRTLHASVNHEGVRRATEGFAEMPTERTDAHPGQRGELIETDRFVQPRFDVLDEPAHLAARKAPTHDRIAYAVLIERANARGDKKGATASCVPNAST